MFTSKSEKSRWVLVVFILAGVVLGGFIGEYVGNFSYLKWLTYGVDYGFTQPFVLNLGIIVVTFALSIKFTIAGLIGVLISILLYKLI